MRRSATWIGIGLATILVLRRLTVPKSGIVAGGKQPTAAQSYGVRRTPTHVHQGVDISAPAGSAVFSAGPGTVSAVWPDGEVSGYGNTVVVRHLDGTQTLYAHLSSFAFGIAKGDAVKKGTLIGYVGTSQSPRAPMTSRPHLHFEAHKNQTLAIREDNPARYEPLAYLAARGLGVSA